MKGNVVVLWGLPDDGPIERVYRILQQKNVPTIFINQLDVLEYSIETTFSGELLGVIHSSSVSLDLQEIHAIYVRPYDLRQLGIFETGNYGNDDWIRAVFFEDTMLLWSEITNARVINRPSSAGSNASKPYQLELIRRAGLKVPKTMLTTDPQRAREFRQTHGRVIYKSISCQRSIVAELGDDFVERINDVIWCPTQFQEYIDGVDYRVHLLEERIFASRICSASSDYRYASDTRIEPVTLPEEIIERCFQLAKSLGLLFSGIDLRRTHEGEWYCFEVNSSPGYTYFEDSNEQPISVALAEMLARPLQSV